MTGPSNDPNDRLCNTRTGTATATIIVAKLNRMISRATGVDPLSRSS